jgi:hypothetical protein
LTKEATLDHVGAATPRTNAPLNHQIDSRNFTTFDAVLTGLTLGVYFALIQQKSTYILIAAYGLAVVCLVRNAGLLRRNFRISFVGWLAVCVMSVNVAIISTQKANQFGVADGLKTACSEIFLIAIVLQILFGFGGRAIRPVLVTLATAFAVFGLLNLLADSIGFGSELLVDRTEFYLSRYAEGRNRWQAPLYSSWPLSGLLRWAMPILVILAVKFQRSFQSRLVFVLGIAAAAWILVLCEFRASALPMVGACVWLLARSTRARAVLSSSYLCYAVLAPLMFYGPQFPNLLEAIIPDAILSLAGNQDIEGILSLTGRTDWWRVGVDALISGQSLWLGQGHVNFDAGYFVGPVAGLDAQLFDRISFHQGFLDVIFIYGLVPALIMVGGLLTITARTVWSLCFRRPGIDQELSLALFSLGMVGLSNCHDGFFVDNSFFYLICFSSASVLSALMSARPASVFKPRASYAAYRVGSLNVNYR